MAITILERPEGHIIDTTQRGNTQIVDSSGDAQFNGSVTDLATGDWIYVLSPVESYNGFWEVSKVAAGALKLIVPTGGFVAYVKTLDTELSPPGANPTFNYYATTLTHGVSAVHLPITYRLSNDLYPTNSVDTSRTVNSVQNANGLTVLQLSGSLGTVHTYDFVKLTFPNDEDLDGVYQIVEYISSTVLIVNIPYDTDNNFTGATALKHYNNYNIVVRVYAGINSGHEWASEKPYELAATLELIPDENNEVFFSINELLKSYVDTRNNLLLGTLPNNIDFWNNFYIEVAEQYDDSDGYVFGTYQGSFTSDQSNFEGMAVNAKLLFKNVYSGYMSDYLMVNNTGKILTLFVLPVLFGCSTNFPDCYQDISFIVPEGYAVETVKQEFYLNGNGPVTVNETITQGSGVIRTQLEADCSYDRVDITLLGGEQLIDEPEFDATGDWLQTATASADWTISGGMASATIGSFLYPIGTEFLYQLISGTAGTYRIKARLTATDLGGPDDWDATAFITFANGGVTVTNQSIGALKGIDVGNITTIDYDAVVTVSGSFDRIGIDLALALPEDGAVTVNILDLEIFITDDVLSETKQFTIDCGCSTEELNMTWLNNLGGFDYWNFQADKDDIVEIREAIETKKNILPSWPKSYGETADTIRKQTARVSNKSYTVRSQHLTLDELNAISFIKSSVLVQIINSRYDKRTVIVDTDSFVKSKDGAKERFIAFNISFTDDIPSQTV